MADTHSSTNTESATDAGSTLAAYPKGREVVRTEDGIVYADTHDLWVRLPEGGWRSPDGRLWSD